MRRAWLTFLTLVLLAITPAAFAQLELGIDAGLMDFGNDFVDDEGPRLSLRASWSFNDWVALEGQVTHSEADTLDAELQTYTINGVVSFRHDKTIQPYVMAGLGWASTELAGLSDDGQATVGAIGIRTFFDDEQTMGLRLETGFAWEDTFGGSTTHVSWSAGFVYRLPF